MFKIYVDWDTKESSSRTDENSSGCRVSFCSTTSHVTTLKWIRVTGRAAFISLTPGADTVLFMFRFTAFVCGGTDRARAGLEARTVDTFGTDLQYNAPC